MLPEPRVVTPAVERGRLSWADEDEGEGGEEGKA